MAIAAHVDDGLMLIKISSTLTTHLPYFGPNGFNSNRPEYHCCSSLLVLSLPRNKKKSQYFGYLMRTCKYRKKVQICQHFVLKTDSR